MVLITQKKIETEISKLITEIGNAFEINDSINAETCPQAIGISSHMLLSATSRLEAALNINIPYNCHLFYDSKEKKRLTIKEASIKLFKMSKNGNNKVGIRQRKDRKAFKEG